MATNSFPTSIAEKLNDSNYLHWRNLLNQQSNHISYNALLSILLFRQYFSELDNAIDVINPAYEVWEVYKIKLYWNG